MQPLRVLVGFTLVAVVGCGGTVVSDGVSRTAAVQPDTYAATQYPIVLIPGLMGFGKLVGTVDYFGRIPDALAAGGAQVFVAAVSQTNTPVTRGQQVIAQLDAWKAQTGASRFNLIAHSQGAMDARYIAAVRPDLVASVTSVGGPHLGAPAAELAIDFPLGLGTSLMQGLADLVKLASSSSDPNDAKAALSWLTPKGAAAFAAQYPAAMPTTPCGSGAPEVDGIRYYSWGGTGTLTSALDLLDPLWVALGVADLTDPNDGLIPRCSSHLGLVLRDDYFANHTDETDLVIGVSSLFGPDPRTLYRDQANRLRNAGL
jgi:triacylglycerol lipase